MPATVTTGAVSDTPSILANRNYRVVLYESNINDTDVHPITGLVTPGLHTKVLTFRLATGLSMTYLLNRPGSAGFSLPLTSDEALSVVGYEVVRSIIVFADPEFVGQNPIEMWSGFIATAKLSSANASIDVKCTGWMQILYAREFRRQLFFNSVDAGIIGARLLGTANNQIANDNVVTGSPGTSAEDLLYGAGELDSLADVSGPLNLDVGFPAFSSSWSYASGILPSGAGGVALQSTNKNGIAYVKVGEQFPVDASSSYMIRSLLYVTARTGTSEARLWINWSDSGGSLISSSYISSTTLGVQELKGTVTSPASAVYGDAFIMLSTGTTGSINTIFDAFYVSKNDIKLRPTCIRLGVVDSPANPTGANRTRTFQVSDKIGKAVEELSNIESGFDWEVALRSTTISGGQTYLCEMNIRWSLVKTATTIRGIGQDRPDVVFGKNFAGNDTLQSMDETRDASDLATRINSRSTGKLAMAQSTIDMDKYNLWEDTVNVADAGVDSNVLLGYAGAEVAYRSRPTRRFDPTPVPYDGTDRVPMFKVHYDIGDIVYLVADEGAMQVGRDNGVKQPARVFGLTVSPDAEGNEMISNCQTAMAS